MGQHDLSTVPEKETNAVDQRIGADLPPKVLARKIVDAAIAEAEAEEDEDMRDFIHCDLGKVGQFDIDLTYNPFDGAQVEVRCDWGDGDVPDFWLNADDVPAMIQALLTAKFAIKMLNKRG